MTIYIGSKIIEDPTDSRWSEHESHSFDSLESAQKYGETWLLLNTAAMAPHKLIWRVRRHDLPEPA